MIEPESRTKDPELIRALLRAIVRDQPFRNSMLVEDSFEMIDDVLELMFVSFRMIESCCVSRQLADIPCHSNGIDR